MPARPWPLLVAWVAACDPSSLPAPGPLRALRSGGAAPTRGADAPYGPLADLSYVSRRRSVSAGGRQLDLRVWSSPGRDAPVDVAAATARILTQLSAQDPGPDCVAVTRLDVYLLPGAVMDDARRFPIRSRRGMEELWGQYDPLDSQGGRAVISLRNLEPRRMERVFAHELAHHWHHRRCLPGSSEGYASAFEERYEAADPPPAVPDPWPTVAAAPRPTAAPAPPRAPSVTRGRTPRERRRARRARRRARRR